MASAETIIQRAFRQDNIIAAGKTPTSAEQTEALEALGAFLSQLIGFEMGEIVQDWQVPVVYTAPYAEENPRDPYGFDSVPSTNIQPPINSRIVARIGAATTVYLPQYPNDGSRIAVVDSASTNNNLTLDANGRKIEGAASLLIDLSADAPAEWMYRADLANWVRLPDFAALSLSDDMPFPSKYDQMIVCGLSMWLAPRYGIGPSDITGQMYRSLVTKFRAQYKQPTITPAVSNINEIQSLRADGLYGFGGGFFDG